MENSSQVDDAFKAFLKKYQKVPVVEYPNNVLSAIPSPLVSCRISTYQHAPYIRQCIEGVLMQKTDYPFEIVIGEDDSSDGTREICVEYAKAYPNQIRLILHDRRNNIAIGGRPSSRFQGVYTRTQCRGEYHAICEGDDFWIDPLKLQKQIDYLQNNTDCSMVFTGCVVDKVGGRSQTIRYPSVSKIGPDEYLQKIYFMATASLVYRAKVWDTPQEDWMDRSFAGDFVLRYRSLTVGYIGYLNSVTCVYRKNTIGSWSLRKADSAVFVKEFRDNIRGLNYLGRHCRIDPRSRGAKLIQLREAYRMRIARTLGLFMGIIYLLKSGSTNWRCFVYHVKIMLLYKL